MFVTFDTEARATYVEVSSAPVVTTVDVSDVVMVDVDGMGQPVGVEFLMLPDAITHAVVMSVVAKFPTLDKLTDLDAWLRIPA